MDIVLDNADAMIVGDNDLPFEIAPEPEIVTKKRKVLSPESKAAKLAYQMKSRRAAVTQELKKEVSVLKKKLIPSNRFHLTRGVDFNAIDDSSSEAETEDKSFDFFSIKVASFDECLDFLETECDMTFDTDMMAEAGRRDLVEIIHVFGKALRTLHKQRRRQPATFSKNIKTAIRMMCNAYKGGAIVEEIKAEKVKEIKKTCFDPVDLSVEMDKSKSSCTNGKSLNLLRGCTHPKKGECTFFPGAKQIERANIDIALAAQEVVGGEVLSEGSAARLDDIKCIDFMLEKLGLVRYGNTNTVIPIDCTIDGLRLTPFQTGIAYGFHIISDLFVHSGSNVPKTAAGVQSHTNCLVMGFYLGKDNNENCKE
jgi:hypothetical protein